MCSSFITCNQNYCLYIHLFRLIYLNLLLQGTVRLNKKLTFRCTKQIVLRYAVNRCVTVRHHRCFSVATSVLRRCYVRPYLQLYWSRETASFRLFITC